MVVVSETFEGMPLLEVHRVQNNCLILRASPFSVLMAYSVQKLQVIKKLDLLEPGRPGKKARPSLPPFLKIAYSMQKL